MIMWLEPGADSSLQAILGGHIIIGAVHLARKDAGLDFDGAAVPALSAPGGIAAARIEQPDMAVQNIVRRVKDRLKSRQDMAAALGPLADHLAFYVFETGEAPIGPGWTLDYAGRTYPLKSGLAKPSG